MQLAMREWRLGKWRGLVSAVAFGLVLGVMGPFGTQSALSTEAKYSFWLVLALVGFGAAAVAERILPSTALGGSGTKRILAVAAASAVPMTFFVAWAMGVVQPGRTYSPLQLLALYPFVALVQLLIARVISTDGKGTVAAPAEQLLAAPKYPREFPCPALSSCRVPDGQRAFAKRPVIAG